MRTKILLYVIIISLMTGMAGLGAAAADGAGGGAAESVEISFKVGDDVLNINGSPIRVETPYVVDGVTLVPVRVITEAFGADVEWIEATMEIILTYRGVEIKLQIGNTDVYVNGQRQALLHHPTLPDKTTMVPLRFITENFGADVKYDEDTQLITVIKSSSAGSVEDIGDALKKSQKPAIGDSYLGWSMQNTPEMKLESRTFDGLQNVFSFGADSHLAIQFADNTANLTYEAIKINEMEIAKNFTLIGQADNYTASGQKYVRTQCRNSEVYIETRQFVRPDGKLVSLGYISLMAVDAAKRENHIAVMDTFDFTIQKSDMEDLSNITDGMRLFDNKDLGIEFMVPADWQDASNSNQINSFEFRKFNNDGMLTGRIALHIHTPERGDTAAGWAARDLSRNKTVTNPKIYTYGDLQEITVSSANAWYYQKEDAFAGIKSISRDIFWEYEGYMYNLYIMVPAGEEELFARIAGSVACSAIDRSKVGVLYMDKLSDDEDRVTRTVKNQSMMFSLDVPATWLNFDNDAFVDQKKGLMVDIYPLSSAMTRSEVNEYFAAASRDKSDTAVKNVTEIGASDLAGGVSGYMFEIYSDETMSYTMHYAISAGGRGYAIMTTIPEPFYSDACRATLAKIIKSFTPV